MRILVPVLGALLAVAAALCAVIPAPILAAGCASGLTLTLHPGRPAPNPGPPLPVAPDLPTTPVTVSLPLYPDARPLKTLLPVAQGLEMTPYLQTGLAEYQSSAGEGTLKKWYVAALTACGWRRNQGSMSTNVSVFTSGLDFVSVRNPLLTLQMAFGTAPTGGTYIAYGVSDITYPRRPANSYVHGPYAQLRLAFTVFTVTGNSRHARVVHTVITNQMAIARLVHAINGLTEYQTVPGLCVGGGGGTSGVSTPIWLSFVRPDGSIEHAFYGGEGACGGLAVNGYRWLIDQGQVWGVLQTLAPLGHGK